MIGMKAPDVGYDLLARYQKRRMEDVLRVTQALEAHDFTAIREVGHRIKGNAALYGLDYLGEIAEEMEEAALGKDWSSLAACARRFESEVNRIV